MLDNLAGHDRLSPMRTVSAYAALILSISSALAESSPECQWSKAMRSDQLIVCPNDNEPQKSQSTAAPIRRDIVYLDELLRSAEYRFVYERMMSLAGNIPTWLRRYNEDRDGLQFPIQIFKFHAQSYQLARVCRPRDADTCLTVLFRMEGGPVAWGYYSEGNSGQWIGVPPLELAENVEARLSNPNFWD